MPWRFHVQRRRRRSAAGARGRRLPLAELVPCLFFGLGTGEPGIELEDRGALVECRLPFLGAPRASGIIVFEGNVGNKGNRVTNPLICMVFPCSPGCSPTLFPLGNKGNSRSRRAGAPEIASGIVLSAWNRWNMWNGRPTRLIRHAFRCSIGCSMSFLERGTRGTRARRGTAGRAEDGEAREVRHWACSRQRSVGSVSGSPKRLGRST